MCLLPATILRSGWRLSAAYDQLETRHHLRSSMLYISIYSLKLATLKHFSPAGNAVDGLEKKVDLRGYFDEDEIYILLVDLVSVLNYDTCTSFTVLHASLPDFLLDQTRSHEYYLDKKLYCTRLSILCLDKIDKKFNDGGMWSAHQNKC